MGRSPSLSSSHGFAIVTAAAAWVAWWSLAFWPLASFWNTSPQYSYGWLVPPLALLLAWRRWQTRPMPEQPTSWARWVIWVSAAVVMPAWIIVQPNPGWRLVPWLLALSAVAGSVGLSAQAGGKSWARHFAFPIAFPLTAVPWPSHPEEVVVQGLMRFVAGATVMFMNLAGVPAIQRGNLVEVATGVLGVDEACSGVRSLQASFMAALFLGEFYRLKVRSRVALVVVGFGAALLTNIARTAFLSYSAARNGIGAVGQWHDPAGYTVLTICLILIAIVANWLRPDDRADQPAAETAPPHALPPYIGPVMGGWLILVVIGAQAWYSSKTKGESSNWTLVLPPEAKEEPLSANTLGLLGCDRTHVAHWRSRTGAHWTLFYLEWFPSNGRTALLARVHRPEVCLPSAGWKEVAPRQSLTVSAAGFDLVFESMQFRDAKGTDAFVFYCPWEIVPGQPGRNSAFSDDTRTASLRRVWRHERLLGQQTAELIVTGLSSRAEAEASLREEIPSLLRRAEVTSTAKR
ncbi:exosortase [Chthoniobacter flavus]|uniref:exosortase/archaeosortase family protein n=1 Tax=Chthoniobacter flavus TaxID=191863 RepID=UPI0005B28AF0|nr:exosortase/archaeosortase family protein [Chthoniobacter flavus]TCO92270.1 exosortase [Chthoniobacter flavus]